MKIRIHLKKILLMSPLHNKYLGKIFLEMLFRAFIWHFVNSYTIRKLTIVAHKGSFDGAIRVSPCAKVWTPSKQLHTVLFVIKIVGLPSIPVSKLCLSFTIEMAIIQGPSPAIQQIIIETYPSLACSKRCYIKQQELKKTFNISIFDLKFKWFN